MMMYRLYRLDVTSIVFTGSVILFKASKVRYFNVEDFVLFFFFVNKD